MAPWSQRPPATRPSWLPWRPSSPRSMCVWVRRCPQARRYCSSRRAPRPPLHTPRRNRLSPSPSSWWRAPASWWPDILRPLQQLADAEKSESDARSNLQALNVGGRRRSTRRSRAVPRDRHYPIDDPGRHRGGGRGVARPGGPAESRAQRGRGAGAGGGHTRRTIRRRCSSSAPASRWPPRCCCAVRWRRRIPASCRWRSRCRPRGSCRVRWRRRASTPATCTATWCRMRRSSSTTAASLMSCKRSTGSPTRCRCRCWTGRVTGTSSVASSIPRAAIVLSGNYQLDDGMKVRLADTPQSRPAVASQ